MMRLNLRQRVNNTSLPQSKPLLPVLEAVVNSFHSLEEIPPGENKFIRITVERDTVVLEGDSSSITNSPINGFTIEDNGCGFTDANMASFLTSDSDHKLSRGGKGVGRFMWLKAFERAEVKSSFEDEGIKTREFTFSLSGQIDDTKHSSIEAIRLTRVRLSEMHSPYKENVPRSLDNIGQRIVEHCLAFFMDPDCPSVTLQGPGAERYDLNKYFNMYIRDRAVERNFSVGGQDFRLQSLRLYHAAIRTNALIFAANKREVKVIKLDRVLPQLPGHLVDEAGEPFAFLGYVTSAYLDRSVNAERTGFSFPDTPGEEEGLVDHLTLQEIQNAMIPALREDLGPFIEAARLEKSKLVEQFVSDTAPQFRPLLRYREEVLDALPHGISDDKMEIELCKFQYAKQVQLKETGRKIFNETPLEATFPAYFERFGEFMDELNDLGKTELAQYVLHRKVVLEFFEKAMKKDSITGNYALEETVHKIIFPMRKTSEDVPYNLQNLWLIDERLTFHKYLTSDKSLSATPPLDSDSRLRPDLLIFDKAMAFTGEDDPVSSFVIIEFKRPERENLRSESPVDQVLNLIEEIRTNHYKDVYGQQIILQSDKVPAFVYIICDLTADMDRIARNASLQKTPDQLGYYGFNSNYNAYIEVMSYKKILNDAKKRNRVFFDKLNIQHHRS